jgi:hypothetical protein
MSNKISAKFGLRQWYLFDSSLSPKSTILRMLGEGFSQSEVAFELKLSKQRVNYWAKKALRDGLLRVQESNMIVQNHMNSQTTEGKPKTYEMTALCQKFLIESERGYCEPCTLEDYAFKYPLIYDRGSLDWKKVGSPNNWVKLGVKLGAAFVEKCLGATPNVIIHTGQLSGFDSEELFFEAGQIVALVKAILQDKGVLLADNGFLIRDPNVKMFTPEAAELHAKYGNLTTPEGTIDNSPPDKIPHEERKREHQRGYLAIPSRIEHIEEQTRRNAERDQRNERRLERIEATQERICIAQERFANTEEKFENLFERTIGQQEPIKKPSRVPEGLYE